MSTTMFNPPTFKLIPVETIQHFVDFEGNVPHFYLDGDGVVTIGIGCAVFDGNDLLDLNLYDIRNNLKASNAQIMRDFTNIKNSEPKHLPEFYKVLCSTYMQQFDIYELLRNRLKVFLSVLPKQFNFYENLDPSLKLVILDMSYNLGVNGLSHKFPRFLESMRLGNYIEAAAECHRVGISDARNKWTKDTLLGYKGV